MDAGGLDPAELHWTSYLRSATKTSSITENVTVSGGTKMYKKRRICFINYYIVRSINNNNSALNIFRENRFSIVTM